MGLHGVSPPDRGRASPRSGWPRGRGQRFPGGGYRQRTSTDGAVTHEPVRRVLERTDGGTADRHVPVIADVGPREATVRSSRSASEGTNVLSSLVPARGEVAPATTRSCGRVGFAG